MSESTPKDQGAPDQKPMIDAPETEESSPARVSPVHGSPTESIPDMRAGLPKRIGHYRIRRLIASGGMGTVYEAAQAGSDLYKAWGKPDKAGEYRAMPDGG